MSMKLAFQDSEFGTGKINEQSLAPADEPVDAAPIEAILLDDPRSIEAEAIRGLRTRIAAQHLREGRRSLAICSPSTGSGCTFVALNLAVAMAQTGVRTALVDANLRDPQIADLCGLPLDMPGLSEYLSGEGLRLTDIIDTGLMPNLAVIGAGEPPHNPQELLSGARFRGLVDQLLREYDFTIFDTAPANGCTDGQRVATIAGFSLIVSRKDKTYVNDVRALSKQLRADKSVVIGTVLNQF